MKNPSRQSGYIAFVTALLLGIVVVFIALSAALIHALNRRGALDAYLKARTDFMARTCLERALLELANNGSYAGNETITIGTDTCQIAAIQSSPPNKIIKTSSTILNSSTHLSMTVDSTSLQTIAFGEE